MTPRRRQPQHAQAVSLDETEDLRALSRKEGRRSLNDRSSAFSLANVHAGVYRAVGFLGVVAGAVAGTAGLFGDDAELAGWAGFAVTLLAGVQTIFRPQEYSSHHFARNAGLGALATKWDALASAPDEPTKQEVYALADEWSRLHQPPRL